LDTALPPNLNPKGARPISHFHPPALRVPMQPAIRAWSGTTVNRIEPDPGNDSVWFMGYEVTDASAGVWHYEYALYNMSLDCAIQSFRLPAGPGVNVSNIGFHTSPQEPGWPNDGTFNNQGYGSTPWSVVCAKSECHAIRWGTLYDFRFDADQPPQATSATVDFFKTESPMKVAIQAPAGGAAPTPTPTPTVTPSPTPTATARPTPTPRTAVAGVGSSAVASAKADDPGRARNEHHGFTEVNDTRLQRRAPPL
jgi:hypothetical protein